MLVSGLSAIFMAFSSQTNVFIENIRLTEVSTQFPDLSDFKLTQTQRRVCKTTDLGLKLNSLYQIRPVMSSDLNLVDQPLSNYSNRIKNLSWFITTIIPFYKLTELYVFNPCDLTLTGGEPRYESIPTRQYFLINAPPQG